MNDFSRRALLAASTLVAGGLVERAVAAPAAPAKPAPRPDATEIAARIRNGEMTALEATEQAIARAEAMQPRLNFMVNSMFDRALAQAKAGPGKGPFAGVPFLVKDLDDVIGVPTRYGSRSTLRHPPARTQDSLIDAFEAAGLNIIGKSATPEHGFLPTTEPLAFGPTRNPWNPARSSGGSSGGAAAAVAAGVVPLAHASDGGGSIRIPASCCGLFGLKPSRGRMIENTPGTRVIDISVNHCVSRSVRDSAALFAATERQDKGAPYPPVGLVTAPTRRKLRIGVILGSLVGKAPHPEVAAAVDGAVKTLTDLGHRVSPTAWPVGPQFSQDFLLLWASGAAGLVKMVAADLGRMPDANVLEPFTLAMAGLVAQAPAGSVEAAIGRLEADSRAYTNWFKRFDVIVSPVLAQPPVEIGFVSGDVPMAELTERLTDYVGFTPLHNVAGGASMSVPLHWTADGLPVGVQFAAAAGAERTLFELAYQLEAARPWAGRTPPVWNR